MIKIRSAMIYLIYLYIFTLPLLSDKFLSGRAGDLLLLLLFFTYFLQLLINREVRSRFIYGFTNFYKDILDIFIAVLFICMFISVFYSFDKNIAVTETLRFLSYIILYFIIKYEVINEKYKENMLKIYIFTASLLSILGIFQYITNFGLAKNFISVSENGAAKRVTVTLSNPNSYGAYLILAIFPVLILAIREKKILNRVMYSIIFIMMLSNIFFTYSRNAWLGFAIGCLVLIFIFSWKLIIIFGGIGILGLFIPQIFNRLSQIFDKAQNISRIVLWKLALKMIKDHPIRGVGNGNYASLYDKYASKYRNLRYLNFKTYPCHNSYLKVQSELGVLGTISFIGILTSSWLKVKNMINKSNNVFIKTFYTGFLASMIAFFFMNIFDNLFFVPKITTFFWIILAISESLFYNNIGGAYGK